MRRRFKSLGMFLLGFVLGTALSVAFAQAVRAEPERVYDADWQNPMGLSLAKPSR